MTKFLEAHLECQENGHSRLPVGINTGYKEFVCSPELAEFDHVEKEQSNLLIEEGETGRWIRLHFNAFPQEEQWHRSKGLVIKCVSNSRNAEIYVNRVSNHTVSDIYIYIYI